MNNISLILHKVECNIKDILATSAGEVKLASVPQSLYSVDVFNLLVGFLD